MLVSSARSFTLHIKSQMLPVFRGTLLWASRYPISLSPDLNNTVSPTNFFLLVNPASTPHGRPQAPFKQRILNEGVVAHAFHPSIQQQVDDWEFKASLSYTVNTRKARNTWRDPASKRKKSDEG